MSNAAATSPIAVGLIVGAAVATITAIYLASGWIVRTLLKRLSDQDTDIAELQSGQTQVLLAMPAMERRITVLERGHKKHRKILNTVTWILELQKGEASVPHRLTYVNPAELRMSRAPADRQEKPQ